MSVYMQLGRGKKKVIIRREAQTCHESPITPVLSPHSPIPSLHNPPPSPSLHSSLPTHPLHHNTPPGSTRSFTSFKPSYALPKNASCHSDSPASASLRYAPVRGLSVRNKFVFALTSLLTSSTRVWGEGESG